MRIAYFDCFSGISGDMTLGAFLDAGLDFKLLSRELKKLGLDGYKLSSSRVKRGEITGTKFDCDVRGGSQEHRPLRTIIKIIEKSALSKKVKDTAKDIFFALGEAEAKIHGVRNKGDIEFHEIGDIDSIVDIVGAAIAVEALGIDEVRASSVSLGRSFVDTMHGTLPIPSPASLELLKGVPMKILETGPELVTPTGAAILKTLSKGFGAMPEMKISSLGYGAGSRDPGRAPNMLRILIGERKESFLNDKICIIETNIDDMSPQNFEYLFERLFAEGALDVYTTTIQMKKTRPAFKLTVLSRPEDSEKLSSVIFRETTSIGVRFYEADRYKLARKKVLADTKYGEISVKVSRGPAGIKTIAPEYEDCARIAKQKHMPFKTIYEEAKQAVCNKV